MGCPGSTCISHVAGKVEYSLSLTRRLNLEPTGCAAGTDVQAVFFLLFLPGVSPDSQRASRGQKGNKYSRSTFEHTDTASQAQQGRPE